MNKLITTDLGGFPFVLDDIRFEQDAVRNAFYGILTAWGITDDESFILSGCEVTTGGGNYNVAAGYVVLSGEVFKVDAHSVAIVGGQTYFWQISETNDPAGLKVFEAGPSYNTYKVRKAVVIGSIGTPVSYLPMLAPTIHEKITEKTAASRGTWAAFDVTTNTTSYNDASGTSLNSPLVANPDGNSDFSYIVTGNKVEISFTLSNLKLIDASTNEIRSVIIENLPFSFDGSQYRTCDLYGGATSATLFSQQGICRVLNGENRIIFNLRNLAATLKFNRKYEFQTTPSIELQEQADGSFQPIWTIRGGATFKIS